MNFHLHLRFGEFSEQDDIDLNFEGVQKQCNLLKVLCTPSDVRSASDRTQRLIWRRTRDPRALFTSNSSVGRAIPDYFEANQWCQTCVSGNSNRSLLITSNEIQRRYSILSLQGASLSSATSYC